MYFLCWVNCSKVTGPIYKQLPGEHVQAFAWRIHSAMIENTGNQDIPEKRLFRRVLLGLHPRVAKYLPVPPPTTFEELLCFGEKVGYLLPPDDQFWTDAESTRYRSPTLAISCDNEYATFIPANPNSCHKCGLVGHFAFPCPNPRNKSIKPKRKNRRGKKKTRTSTRGGGMK